MSLNEVAPMTKNATFLASQSRQIRFVPNDGLPHAKRRRINAACQTCRKRKTRCSGERPVCKTCSDNGHACLGYMKPSKHHPKRNQDHAGSEEDSSDSSQDPVATPAPPPKTERRSRRPPHEPVILSSLGQPSESNITSPMMQHRSPAHLQKLDSDMSEGRSPASIATSTSYRDRVPYFRYFGPTAIVPGFKQMVVSMKEPRRSHGSHSVTGESPGSALLGQLGKTPSVSGSDSRGLVEMPFYDANDAGPVPPLITHLCETFFANLGCNYPFLQRARFLRDLGEKRVDGILVDAVCAIAGRFSNHPLLTTPNEHSVEIDTDHEVQRAFRGHAFAQRAMSAVVDTFACPTIAVAQACLLLAYDEFGSNHDSGLWMYLGTSIRMAQDLGVQKLEGLRLEGRLGPTPKTAKQGSAGGRVEREREEYQKSLTHAETKSIIDERDKGSDKHEIVPIEDRRANERERIDTFYAIFFLDRVVSSGTGRPVTLRDKDIEISFPFRFEEEYIDGWPPPFPPLIRIIHLYGRVTDVLNGIKDVHQVTPEVLKRLAGMEKELTGIYQGLSPKLHFNATNFQRYVKAEQGTNFILLHFWFHTLIVIMHQPTLLHSFGGNIQQLFPDSRELSMSSAKTIADILAFAELIDAKSFIGNPFTTQPIYIAATAFLAEMASHASMPSSGGSTPPEETSQKRRQVENPSGEVFGNSKFGKTRSANHSLLATAANQNYQRCYKALKALEDYWAGTRYILTALDQKAQGIMDPLLYTDEDVESAIEVPRPVPAFSTPGWRRSTTRSSIGSFSYPQRPRRGPKEEVWSPGFDASQAIGWSLTGTMNSPNPNLSFLYSMPHTEPSQVPSGPSTVSPSAIGKPPPHQFSKYQAQAGNILPPQLGDGYPMQTSLPTSASNSKMLPPSHYTTPQTDRISDADLLLGLRSPSPSTTARPSPHPQLPFDSSQFQPQPPSISSSQSFSQTVNLTAFDTLNPAGFHTTSPFDDTMMIESQDIDVQGDFAFSNGEVIPWLEYLPQDVLNYFGEGGMEHQLDNGSAAGPDT